MTRRIRLLGGAVAVLALAATLVGCTGQHYRCPESIPGPPGGQNIPVLLTEDDTGQAIEGEPSAFGDYACEADANRNGLGDETEVEQLEEGLNGAEE